MPNLLESPTCTTCEGMRRVIRRRQDSFYPCGSISEAHTCPDCNGTGKGKREYSLPTGTTLYALLLILCGLLAHPMVLAFHHVTLRFAEVLK